MIFIFFFSKCTDLAPHSLNYHNLLTILNWKGPFGTSKAPRTIHILIQSLGPVALWSRVRYYNTSKIVVHAHLPLRHPKSRLGFVCNNIVRFRPFVRSFRLPLMWFYFVRFLNKPFFTHYSGQKCTVCFWYCVCVTVCRAMRPRRKQPLRCTNTAAICSYRKTFKLNWYVFLYNIWTTYPFKIKLLVIKFDKCWLF